MAVTLDSLRVRRDLALQDKAERLSAEARDAALNQAFADYSRDRPRLLVVDIAGSGVFDLALPAAWAEGFSVVKQIEFPANKREPEYLDREDWQIYEKPTGKVIRLLKSTPTASEVVRITFTAPHLSSAATLTIAEQESDALVDLAAAYCFERLAAIEASRRDPTLAADVATTTATEETYLTLARNLRKRYRERLGLEGEAAGAASGSADWNLELGGGEAGARLTHPLRGDGRR